MKLWLWENDQLSRDYRFESQQVRIGRDPSCELVIDGAKYPKVSGLHAELQITGEELQLIPRSRSNQTLHNGSPISSPIRLSVGDRFRLGFTGPEFEFAGIAGTSPRKEKRRADAVDDAPPETMMADSESVAPAQILRGQRFDISKGGLLGRDVKVVAFHLDHPHVSRVHAKITCAANQLNLSDMGSANGTFHNGLQVTRPIALSPGDTIDVGPFSLDFDGKYLISRSRADNVQLCCSGIDYEVNDNNTGKKIQLLLQIELVFNPGEFVCILGPSGSGKSTLLNLLSGRRLPNKGNVYLNGRDLHRNFAAMKQDLAVVPQSTDLYRSLTVEQSFRFTSELRLPTDLGKDELKAAVNETLQLVGLEQRRHVRISHLSGGQLKRAGLGSELLAEPTLLFLDEVTSGLDEHSDGEMMRLFRSLADRGKTLVCITHNLSHVEDNCHLVAVLTDGGRLAFLGTPSEAMKYFRVKKLADIYLALQTQDPESWATSFRSHSLFQKYVQERMPKYRKGVETPGRIGGEIARASFTRQSSVLLRRTLALWRGDIMALVAMFSQSLLVAILLCLVFGQLSDVDMSIPMARQSKIQSLLFLIGVSCFWLGCNNCVKEIVKERATFQRERDFNLIPESYLFSKLIFFALIGFLQATFLGVVTLWWFGMPGDRMSMLLVFLGLSFAGTTLGLAISSWSKSEEIAVAAVPIAIIPQIILTGVVASLSTLPEWISKLAISVFWGQKAVEQALPEVDRMAASFQPNFALGITLVVAHGIAFLVTAIFGVRYRRAG